MINCPEANVFFQAILKKYQPMADGLEGTRTLFRSEWIFINFKFNLSINTFPPILSKICRTKIA